MADPQSADAKAAELTKTLLFDLQSLYQEIEQGPAVGHEDDPAIPPNELRIYMPGPEGEEPCFRIVIEPVPTPVTCPLPEPTKLESDGLQSFPDDRLAFFKELVDRWRPLRQESDEKKVASIGLMMDRGLVDWLDDRLQALEGRDPE